MGATSTAKYWGEGPVSEVVEVQGIFGHILSQTGNSTLCTGSSDSARRESAVPIRVSAAGRLEQVSRVHLAGASGGN